MDACETPIESSSNRHCCFKEKQTELTFSLGPETMNQVADKHEPIKLQICWQPANIKMFIFER